jgi:hypothetical protein
MAEPIENISSLLRGSVGSTKQTELTWDAIVAKQIEKTAANYSIQGNDSESVNVRKILQRWHRDVTQGYKRDDNFTPHINGFYMIFMVHGTWYDDYQKFIQGQDKKNLSVAPDGKQFKPGMSTLSFKNNGSYFNMLATDIEIPDMTEEYTSVSSRLRNSFVPSRNYFVSDFSISYIENINMDVMRYHEAWHKYMTLIRRGELNHTGNCDSGGYFLEMPYTNAVWVAVFRPFTTDIQLIVKLIGVMPVTMPLKQLIGNRSASKMTVLNISYKSADLFYKFYNNTQEFINDNGELAKSFRFEVMNHSDVKTS